MEGSFCAVTKSVYIKVTIDKMRSGFLPYTSEAAPITGEAMNCRSENREPIRPATQNHTSK